MSTQRIVIVKKCGCEHENHDDMMTRLQKAERERKRKVEAEKIKLELLTLARRVEALTTET